MLIGVDLDHTIINYEPVIRKAARDVFGLPEGFDSGQSTKEAFKKAIGNDAWTEFQAELYGKLIYKSRPYLGFQHFFTKAKQRGHTVSVVSHKTRDLRTSAATFLSAYIGQYYPWLGNVHFLDTLDDKVEKINELDCDVFIDDKLSVLERLPQKIRKIFFNPDKTPLPAGWHEVEEFGGWGRIEEALMP